MLPRLRSVQGYTARVGEAPMTIALIITDASANAHAAVVLGLVVIVGLALAIIRIATK